MGSEKTISAVKARVHFGEVMKRTFKEGDHFIVEKAGIPMVVILNAQEYTRLVAREERAQVIDRIRANAPSLSTQEVERDTAQAIRAVRRGHA